MKTSIHIQGVKPSSESHNKRETKLDYVRDDLSKNNESYIVKDLTSALKEIKSKYSYSTGQRFQDNAKPIREGVIVIKPETTIHDLIQLSKEYEKTFKIKTLQIYIHRDEGHNGEDTRFVVNHHAHMLFDWTDNETCKSVKLNARQMAQMQTITADVLGMQRGESSDLKHLNSIQYKTKAEAERLKLIQNDLAHFKAIRETLSSEADKNIATNLLGVVDRLKTAQNIASLIYENNQLKSKEKSINDLENKLREKNNRINDLLDKASYLQYEVSSGQRIAGTLSVKEDPEIMARVKAIERFKLESNPKAKKPTIGNKYIR